MREWLQEILGLSENAALGVAFVISLIVVLALFALVLWVFRRIGTTHFGTARRTRQPRIAVMDQTSIDARRRLLLVRRDNVEHLVLIGGPTDVVVEQNIIRGQTTRAPYPQTPVQQATAKAPVPVAAEPSPARQVPAAAAAAGAATGAIGAATAASIASVDEAAADAGTSTPTAANDGSADPAQQAGGKRRRAAKLPQQASERAPLSASREHPDLVRKKRPMREARVETERPRPVSREPVMAPRNLDKPAAPAAASDRTVPPAPSASPAPESIKGSGARKKAADIAPVPDKPVQPKKSQPRPSRGPASRLSENLFSRNKDGKPSRVGSLSASIAAAAGLGGSKAMAKETAEKNQPKPEDGTNQVTPLSVADVTRPVEPAITETQEQTTEDRAETTAEAVKRPDEPEMETAESSDIKAEAESAQPDAAEPETAASPDTGTEVEAESVDAPPDMPPDDVEESPAEAPDPEIEINTSQDATDDDASLVESPLEKLTVDVTEADPASSNTTGSEIELDLGLLTESDAPVVEVGAGDKTSSSNQTGDSQSDSIEEEMAKLLSELSGKPNS